MIAHDHFPVRPRYLRGESLAGYVYRFYSMNGHTTPEAVEKIISILYGTTAAAFDRTVGAQIGALLGHHCPFDATNWVEAWRKVRRVYLPGLRATKSRRGRIRLCPSCICTDGIHLSLWELPLVLSCPVHRCKLKARCDGCGRFLEWSRLSPDWRCGCGFPLADLETEQAGSVELMQATAICRASDLQVSDSHVELIDGAADSVSLSLASVYQLLYQFFDLRGWIVHHLRHGLEPRERNLKKPSNARNRPHRWECDLLAQWPRGLQGSLLRLAQRACRAENLAFITLHPNSPIRHCIDHLVRGSNECWITDPVRHAVLQLIDEFRVAFPAQTPILYNPNLAQVERMRRIQRFGQWWGTLRQSVPCSQGHGNLGTSTWLSHPASEQDKEALVVQFLNQLFELVDVGVVPQRCYQVFDGWQSAGSISESEDPDVLLGELWATLIRMPKARLANMVYEADRIDRGGAP